MDAYVQQNPRPDQIGLQKRRGIVDRAVYMGLSREVYENVRLFLLKNRLHCLPVGDIAPDKPDVFFFQNRG